MRGWWRLVEGMLVGIFIGYVPCTWAESRPIEQLPQDLIRFSTVWLHIPQEMMAVGQEEGPLGALTWGSTKGTVVMLQSTTRDVWDIVKPDEHPTPIHRDPQLFVRYEF